MQEAIKNGSTLIKYNPFHNKKKTIPQKTSPIKKPTIGRNDPCTCGSGKKYKNCCYNFAHDELKQAMMQNLVKRFYG